MISLTIPISFRKDGALVDADAAPTIVVRRNDTGATVATGTMTRVSAGYYTYLVADATAGVAYSWTITAMLAGKQVTANQATTVQASAALPSYMQLAEADALAATVFGLPRYKAADPTTRLQLLTSASMAIDAAHRWQGQRITEDQALEFPRQRDYAVTTASGWLQGGTPAVPAKIKLAVLHQADATANTDLQAVKDVIAAGLTGKTTGSMSEQYRAGGAGQMGSQLLCPAAASLVASYISKQGKVL